VSEKGDEAKSPAVAKPSAPKTSIVGSANSPHTLDPFRRVRYHAISIVYRSTRVWDVAASRTSCMIVLFSSLFDGQS
jgi:hypothetical protein